MLFKFHKGEDARRVAEWVAARIEGCERGFGPCVAMSVGDPVIGAVVFHNWNPEGGVMEMSAAADSPRWLNRQTLQAMHGYIFDDAACQLAVMRVSERNTRMKRIAEAFGYTPHTVPRLRGRDTAEIIYTLPDDVWRASKYHTR